MKPSPARHLFQNLARQPEAQLSLAEMALALAWEDQGGAAPMAALDQLDAFSAALRSRLTGLDEPGQVVATINAYLFADLGFRGEVVAYNDPINSFLDRVL